MAVMATETPVIRVYEPLRVFFVSLVDALREPFATLCRAGYLRGAMADGSWYKLCLKSGHGGTDF